ncbi:MAG: hypothetical protein AAFY58_08890, partial [Planctomycetota bacterium]
ASSCCCIDQTPASTTPAAGSSEALPSCCALQDTDNQTRSNQPDRPAEDSNTPTPCDCPASCCTTILKTTLTVPLSPAVIAAAFPAATRHAIDATAPMSTTLQGLERPPRAARAA